jgi:AcrR family transcriptional regulator
MKINQAAVVVNIIKQKCSLKYWTRKMPRRYELKRRASRQNETRQRIVEATVHLHQTLGGAKTTISAIAEKAGVERLTVYRHFPDEKALLTACTSHYLALNPPPDPAAWERIFGAEERLRTALSAIYAFHRRNEPMFSRTASDLEEIPVLREVLAPFLAYWAQVRDVLSAPWHVSGRQRTRVRAFVGHAISFQTWRSLVREQVLKDAEVVDLFVKAVSCVSKDEPKG